MPAATSIDAPAASGPAMDAIGGRLSTLCFRDLLLTLAVVYLVLIVPFFTIDVPPLVDYPSHLVRIKIIAEWAGVPQWHDFYEVHWRVLPNLAFEVFAYYTWTLLGAAFVGRFFMAAILLLFLGGTLAVSYAVFREYAVWPLLSGLFFYNWILLYGFINYLFGIALALCAIAAWILLRDRPRLALVASGLFAVALFFAHLVALVVYAVCILVFEAACALRARTGGPQALTRRLLFASVQFVVPALLFVSFSPTASELAAVGFESLRNKALFLLGLPRSGDQILDLTSMALYAAALGTLVWRRSLRIRAPFGLVLSALAIMFLVSPSHMATTANLDKRLPVFGCFLFFGVTQLTRRRGVETLMMAVLAAWMLVRPTILAFEWKAYDSVYDEYRAAFRLMASGSTLFVAAPSSAAVHTLHRVSVKPGSSPYPRGWNPPLRHVATLAILDRAVFVPQIFAYGSQQPLQIHPDFRPLATFQTNDPLLISGAAELRTTAETMWRLQEEAWNRHGAPAGQAPQTYLLWLSSDRNNPAPDLLRAVRGGTGFQLFEIKATGQGRIGSSRRCELSHKCPVIS